MRSLPTRGSSLPTGHAGPADIDRRTRPARLGRSVDGRHECGASSSASPLRRSPGTSAARRPQDPAQGVAVAAAAGRSPAGWPACRATIDQRGRPARGQSGSDGARPGPARRPVAGAGAAERRPAAGRRGTGRRRPSGRPCRAAGSGRACRRPTSGTPMRRPTSIASTDSVIGMPTRRSSTSVEERVARVVVVVGVAREAAAARTGGATRPSSVGVAARRRRGRRAGAGSCRRRRPGSAWAAMQQRRLVERARSSSGRPSSGDEPLRRALP